jgi:hypothetical protein
VGTDQNKSRQGRLRSQEDPAPAASAVPFGTCPPSAI